MHLLGLIWILPASFAIVIGSSCPQPKVPENGHVVFPSTEPPVQGTQIRYQCDVGFMRLGPETRDCLVSGDWSEHSPICAVNVALYRPSRQSGSAANRTTDGDFQTCSQGSPPGHKHGWWEVDLLEVHTIYAVEVVYRKEDPADDSFLGSIEIYVGEHPITTKGKSGLCYKHQGDLSPGEVHTFICAREPVGRYVSIRTSQPHQLNLCEVMILSRFAASFWQCGILPSMDRWGVYDSGCYHASQESQPWFSGRTHCLMSGANIVEYINTTEHWYMISQLRYRAREKSEAYWTGLVNDQRGQWVWSGGGPPQLEFWAAGERPQPTTTEAADSPMAMAAAMTRLSGWDWDALPQAEWNNWICKSKPLFCASPGVPENGGVMLSNQNYGIQTTAYYYCSFGYVVQGSETRVCAPNGTWSGRPPFCAPVFCGGLQSIDNGKVDHVNDSSIFGSYVEYSCLHGYTLEGQTLRQCQADGQWSGSKPICKVINCGPPLNVTHANLTFMTPDKSTHIGSRIRYECLSGYRLMNGADLHCTVDGRWSPDPPVCVDVATLRSAVVSDENSKEDASPLAQYSPNLMAGFIAAVLVLVVLVSIVAFWAWRRRKPMDSNSVSGTSRMPFGMGGHRDILYGYADPSLVLAQQHQHHHQQSLSDQVYYIAQMGSGGAESSGGMSDSSSPYAMPNSPLGPSGVPLLPPGTLRLTPNQLLSVAPDLVSQNASGGAGSGIYGTARGHAASYSQSNDLSDIRRNLEQHFSRSDGSGGTIAARSNGGQNTYGRSSNYCYSLTQPSMASSSTANYVTSQSLIHTVSRGSVPVFPPQPLPKPNGAYDSNTNNKQYPIPVSIPQFIGNNIIGSAPSLQQPHVQIPMDSSDQNGQKLYLLVANEDFVKKLNSIGGGCATLPRSFLGNGKNRIAPGAPIPTGMMRVPVGPDDSTPASKRPLSYLTIRNQKTKSKNNGGIKMSSGAPNITSSNNGLSTSATHLRDLFGTIAARSHQSIGNAVQKIAPPRKRKKLPKFSADTPSSGDGRSKSKKSSKNKNRPEIVLMHDKLPGSDSSGLELGLRPGGDNGSPGSSGDSAVDMMGVEGDRCSTPDSELFAFDDSSEDDGEENDEADVPPVPGSFLPSSSSRYSQYDRNGEGDAAQSNKNELYPITSYFTSSVMNSLKVADSTLPSSEHQQPVKRLSLLLQQQQQQPIYAEASVAMETHPSPSVTSSSNYHSYYSGEQNTVNQNDPGSEDWSIYDTPPDADKQGLGCGAEQGEGEKLEKECGLENTYEEVPRHQIEQMDAAIQRVARKSLGRSVETDVTMC